MRDFSKLAVQGGQYIIEANFYVSVLLVIMGSVLSLTDHSIFEFNVALYGELANNLRAIMGYLAFSEIMIVLLCWFTKQYQYFILVGFSLLLMIGSVKFYSQINNIETDPTLDLCLLYAGLSHIVFGWITLSKQKLAKY